MPWDTAKAQLSAHGCWIHITVRPWSCPAPRLTKMWTRICLKMYCSCVVHIEDNVHLICCFQGYEALGHNPLWLFLSRKENPSLCTQRNSSSAILVAFFHLSLLFYVHGETRSTYAFKVSAVNFTRVLLFYPQCLFFIIINALLVFGYHYTVSQWFRELAWMTPRSPSGVWFPVLS